MRWALKVHRRAFAKRLSTFEFNSENFQRPNLPTKLKVLDVPVKPLEELHTLGARLLTSRDEVTTEKGNFEIVKWPVQGWRALDPHTGDEGGTTEGPFQVSWTGDFYFGHNLAVATTNNRYLDGLGAMPEHAKTELPAHGDGSSILLWMSDYHPDGGQSFFPSNDSHPYAICLGPASVGDDVRPEHMVAFHIPAGKGVYLKPGTWHNGVYVHRCHTPAQFFTRQGRVHARVSCSWAFEAGMLLRVPLPV